MLSWKIAVVALFAMIWRSSDGQTEQQWLCGACRIMNHEISKDINSADDSRTTVSGSYRIDPNGNQKTVERKFKRSALHIHEVMEKVCDHMQNYGRLISAEPGKTADAKIYQFVRGSTAEGQNSEYVDKSPEVRNKLKHKCDDILEAHEEWIEDFFSKEVTAEDGDRELCLMRAGYCRMRDLLHSLVPPPIPNPKKEEEKKAESEQEEGQEQEEKSEL